MTKVGVVIVNYNTKDLTLDCLDSILKKRWKSKLEVVLVDNNSTDGSISAVSKKYPELKIIKSNKNLGFAGGNNLGIDELLKNDIDYVLLINSDTKVLDKSLDILVDFAEKNKYQISSCKLLNPDLTFQPNAGDLPTPLPVFLWVSGLDDIFRKVLLLPSFQQRYAKYYKKQRSVGWVSGSVMLIKRDVLEKIGLLDEKIFMYAEDVDYCWRAYNAGFKIGWTDKAEIIHIGGASSSSPRETQWIGELKGLVYLYKKNYGLLAVIYLRVLYYIFIPLRALAFLILGRRDYAKTYAKIITKI